MPPLNNAPTSPILIEDSDEYSNGSQTPGQSNVTIYYANMMDAAALPGVPILESPGNNELNCDILATVASEETAAGQGFAADAQCDRDDAEENAGAGPAVMKIIYSCYRCKLSFSSRLAFEEHYK